MPVTRSKTLRRSQSVPLLPLRARSIPQTPLYQPPIPIALPLPIIRATLIHPEELPLIVLQRPLPRQARDNQFLHHSGRPRRVSINPKDVSFEHAIPLHTHRRSASRETTPPPSRGHSPLTDISETSDTSSVEVGDETTIPKPPGEAGRPESGGYNPEV